MFPLYDQPNLSNMNKLIIDIHPEHLNLSDLDETEERAEIIQALTEATEHGINQDNTPQSLNKS